MRDLFTHIPEGEEDRLGTQRREVLEYLRIHPDGMTRLDALNEGVMQIQTRIFELRAKGYSIRTDWREVMKKNGKTARIGVYVLEGIG